MVMKKERIGEVNFKEFKTKFSITPKVKKYLEKEQVSLAVLLPNGWEWYETELFYMIEDKNGKPNKKYGKKFEVIYYGVIEKLDLIEKNWDKEDLEIKEEGFSENLGKLDKDKNFIEDVTMTLSSTPKNQNKRLGIKYIIRKLK